VLFEKLVQTRALPRTVVRTINRGEVLERALGVCLHGLATLLPVGGAYFAIFLLNSTVRRVWRVEKCSGYVRQTEMP
jgi:hypothetical protein